MKFKRGLAAVLALVMIFTALPFGELPVYGAEEILSDSGAMLLDDNASEENSIAEDNTSVLNDISDDSIKSQIITEFIPDENAEAGKLKSADNEDIKVDEIIEETEEKKQETEENGSVVQAKEYSGDPITRGQWLHKIVTAFKLTAEEDYMVNDYYPDVTSSYPYYKSIRIAILFKSMRNEFNRILHPNAILPVRVNGKVSV